MRKKTVAILTLIVTMLFAINVNASEAWEVNSRIEKGEDNRVLYNSMPTEVSKGDIISVKLVVANAQDWRIGTGFSSITWDENAFEIVETNGKYYTLLNENVSNVTTDFSKQGMLTLHYTFTNSAIEEYDQYLIELKFKVKNSANNGVYKISQLANEDALSIYIDDNYATAVANAVELRYQVGKVNLSSNINKDDVEKSTYIIGNYMFTREGSDEYDGILTTPYIMLASKSIEGNTKEDMIVYIKNARGNWLNAITNEEITPPNSFKISHIDMKANYQENGIYSDELDETLLRLIQINDSEVIVTIETNQEYLHGIGTISNRVVTFTANGKTYTLTISDDQVTINTDDTSITSTTLQKRANVTLNDYYSETYNAPGHGTSANPVQFLKSEQTGKYSNENYEINFLRIDENNARVTLSQKDQPDCLFDDYAANADGSYQINFADETYSITWSSDQLVLACTANCDEGLYAGTYTKEADLTMEDVFHIWEQSEALYAVTFNKDNGEEPHVTYVSPVEPVSSCADFTYYVNDHNKDGFIFVEWQLNGEPFDFDTVIDGPITLVATYKQLPAAPTISIVYQDGHDYYSYENDEFEYHLLLSTDDEYEGYEIYDKSSPNTAIIDSEPGATVAITVPVNAVKTYFIKTYIKIGETKHYSNPSNEVTLHPRTYTVSFNSNGGSAIDNVTVPYDSKVAKPTDPTKEGRTFAEWQLNGETYDFDTPITGAITLDAKWELDVTAPVLAVAETGSYYVRGLNISNSNTYCTSAQCDGSPSDEYSVVGFEVYEKINGNYVLLDSTNIGETYSLSPEPNTKKTYAARLYIIENSARVYSQYSEDVEVDATYVAPTLSYQDLGVTGQDMEQYSFTVDATAYEYMSNYKVSGFDVFKVTGNQENPYELVGGSNTITGAATITTERGTVDSFVAMAYALNSSSQKVYSDASNEVSTLAKPVMQYGSATCANGVCSIFAELDNVSWYVRPQNQDPDDMYIINRLEFYIVDGENYELIKTVVDGNYITQLNLEMSLYDEVSIVTKVFALNSNNVEISSEYSAVTTFTGLSLLPVKDNVTLDCGTQSTYHIGETFTCTVSALTNNDTDVAKYTFDLDYSDTIELIDTQTTSNVANNQVSNGRYTVTLTNPASNSGTDSQVVFTFRVKESGVTPPTTGQVDISNVWFASSTNVNYKVANVTLTKQIEASQSEADPACYSDGTGTNHWTNNPEQGWTEVPTATTELACLEPST